MSFSSLPVTPIWRGISRLAVKQYSAPAIGSRQMHTPGRQIPNHPTPTTSAHNSIPQSLDQHSNTIPNDAVPNTEVEDISGSIPTHTLAATTARLDAQAEIATHRAGVTRFTPKGRPILSRPPASTSIPGSDAEKVNPDHPLWKFFRVDPRLTQPLGGMGLTTAEIAEGVYEESEGEGMISVEPIFGEETNLTSGAFVQCQRRSFCTDMTFCSISRSIMDSQGTARKVFCGSAYAVVHSLARTQCSGNTAGRTEKTWHLHGQRVADKEGIQGESGISL